MMWRGRSARVIVRLRWRQARRGLLFRRRKTVVVRLRAAAVLAGEAANGFRVLISVETGDMGAFIIGIVRNGRALRYRLWRIFGKKEGLVSAHATSQRPTFGAAPGKPWG